MPRRKIAATSTTVFFEKHLTNQIGQPWLLWFRQPTAAQFDFYGGCPNRKTAFSQLKRLTHLGFEAKLEYVKAGVFTPSERETGR